MPISYTPQGRRVALGTTEARGFNPVQAADNSQNVLKQGQATLESFAKAKEYDLANPDESLKELAKLSKTVADFMVERQKGINENDRKLGVADILNGDLQPKPEALQTYRENTETLKVAVQGENQALNALQQTEPVQAIEIRAKDPVLSAWRSYGQAQGIALRAASTADSALTQAMASKEATIPITDKQGNTQFIAPSEAKDHAQLNAVWAVVLQGFIRANGLDGPEGILNPLLLAETVTPKITEIKARIFKEQHTRIAKAQAEEVKDNVLTLLNGAIANTPLDDVNALHEVFQNGAKALVDNVNMDQASANEAVYKSLLQRAEDSNDDIAVDRIEQIRIARDNSGSKGTLGIRFPGLAGETRDRIVAKKEAARIAKEQAQKATVENLVNAYKISIRDKTPDEVAKLYDQAKLTLEKMVADKVVGASDALVKFEEEPRRMAGQAYQDAIIRKQLDNPGYYTKAQIQRAIADGVLPTGFENRMSFPVDTLAPQLQSLRPTVVAAVKASFTNRMSSTGGWKPEDIESGQFPTRQKHMVEEVIIGLRKGLSQDPKLEPNRFIEDYIKQLETRPWYKFNPRRSLKPGFPVEFERPLRPNEVSVNVGAKGPSIDFSSLNISPITFQGLTVPPRSTFLKPDALKEAIDVYKKTGAYPDAVLPAIRATGLTQSEFTRVQSEGLQGLAERAQGLQLAIKDNPRSTPLELFVAEYELRRKPQIQQAGSTPVGGIFPEAAELLRDLGKGEGGPKGYEAANMGKANDLPAGVPGLTGMTIDQVLGMSKIHHVGKYQFQLGKGRTLESLKTRMGLSGSEKLTPELQDRMAMELMYGGWKQPALTAYLKGGTNLEKAVVGFNNEWEVGKLGFNVRPYLQRMRAAYVNRGAGAVGRAGNFKKENLTSINYERPDRGDSYQKGGVDLYFEDKQFPALLPGKVIEIGNQPGGYGIWVTTEHIDPKTGQPFQLINAHFDAVYVKEGQTLQTGTILGKQGATGNAPKGPHSSIDPIMPAPRGSRAQVPYNRPGLLKELLTNLSR